MRCPVAGCGAEALDGQPACPTCGADLRAYGVAIGLADLHFNRGLAHARAGDLAGAERELRIGLAFRPEDHESGLVLGKVLWLRGAQPEAKAILERLAALPGGTEVSRQAARCLEADAAKPGPGAAPSGPRHKPPQGRRKRH